jgi:hypothetical protein
LTVAIETEVAMLTPTDITVAGAQIDIVPAEDLLHVETTLSDLHVGFQVEAIKGLGDLIAGPATMDASVAQLTLAMSVTMHEGALKVEPTFSKLEFTDFVLATETYPLFKDKYPDLHKLIKGYIESKMGDTIGSMIAELLTTFLGGFAYQKAFGEENPVTMLFAMQSVKVASHGLNLTLSAQISSPLGIDGPLPLKIGSLNTDNELPSGQFSKEPIAFAIDDDLLNQLTFAMWHSGALGQKEFVGEELEALGLSALPPVFQPLTRVAYTTHLPLTIGPRFLDDDERPYELSLGELELVLESGTEKRFALSFSARTGVDVLLTEDGTLQLLPDVRPKFMQLAIACTEAPAGIDPGSVAALLRLGFPLLLSKASAAFSFPMIGFSMDALTDLAPLQGKEIAFTDLKSRITGPEGVVLVLEGGAVFQDKVVDPEQ